MTDERTVIHRVQWVQWGLAAIAIGLLPWLVSPGRTEPDTKIDLTISPWRYLGRALDAWNTHAGLGELQNQAYGYLFPMGPVFGIARSLAIPAWATQRIWWTLLLVVAFAGTGRLIRRLGVAGPLPALVAAAAYALSPRMLTVLPVISVEAWPMAVAPWLVLAVLPLTERDLPRAVLIRQAALAGALTAALGGVNATASGIVLALPFAYLVTDPVGRRRLLWWLPAVLLGALWWLLPLLVLGRYAYPFLDYIETASITTAVTSVPNVLRGANDWIAYILDSADHPVWQGGWVLAQSITAILATCVLAGIGGWGLLRQRGHLARWTLGCLVGATLFMALGHGGSVGSPLSADMRGLLDGALAPLRNVHKADPMLRLPLAIGFAAVLQRVTVSRRMRDRFLPAALALLVAVAATPIWQGRVGSIDAYAAVPRQWTQVAHEIDAAAAESGGSTMLLPNSRTSTYTWGATTDEPLSALATSPVVTRAAAPLGIPASTRILDTVDRLAASGVPQPSLADGLARLGISRLVLRRDLATSVQALPWQQVEKTLRSSPGIRVSATYGSGTSALTVYDVTPATGARATSYAAEPLRVAGGPEASFALAATGLLAPDEWLQLDSADERPDVVTDTMRWRAYNNGVPTARAYSPTLTRGDHRPDRIGARDLPPATDPSVQPARVWTGWSGVHESSSGADPFARAYVGPQAGAYAAVDGDPQTAWLTGDHETTAVIGGDLGRRRVSQVQISLAGPAQGAVLPREVQVQVGDRTRSVPVNGRDEVTVPVDAADGGALEVRLIAPSGVDDPVMGIRELHIPGVDLGSVIDIPQPVDPSRQALLLTHDTEDGATLSRRVDLSAPGDLPSTVWLRPAAGATLSGECGAAGTITVQQGGKTVRIPLQAGATREQVQQRQLIPARACGPATLPAAGQTTLTVKGAKGLQPELALLGHAPPAVEAGARKVTAATGDSGRRTVTVSAGPESVVALNEGFNAGWEAIDSSGRALQPVQVDGWRQGFRLPAGAAEQVRLTFTPTTPQRAGLLVGGVAAIALLGTYLAAAWLCRRRGRVTGAGAGLDTASASAPAYSTSAAPGCSTSTAPGRWTRIIGGAVAVLLGGLVAGPAGLLAGLAAAAVPHRWLRHTALGALVLAGLSLAFFGVVDAKSAGAIAGQLLGTVTLGALARGLVEHGTSNGAPSAGSATRPTPQTPTRSAR
ncbi:alpha-(1-_3)-arabinofuranosyltransferase domain-containing protein [Flexivirga meconopsidis]|uniref:alpha-(1->3)-arabinofuranosyltransferase domain-containing protein n=1 Tax=Flexivirga meconopsidis TaxID=2977121 RepID=UPI0022404031|nr:alpha-(1->3)-arabinofuranosyltransferase family protein [Flexivirga meconopsidis]